MRRITVKVKKCDSLESPSVNNLKAVLVNEPKESMGFRPSKGRTRRDALRVGEIEAKRGNSVAAIAAADDVLREDPEHLGALELKAKSQWKVGEYEPLLDTLRRLVILNPYEAGYHSLRGAALQSLGRYGEAVRAFERATGMAGQEEILADLRSWQAALIKDMMRTDLVFRAHYRQDPVAACAMRGFCLPNRTADRFVPSTANRATLSVRPS